MILLATPVSLNVPFMVVASLLFLIGLFYVIMEGQEQRNKRKK